jgi:hypothetical protein
LDIQDFQNITDLYEFIFKILLENKLKIFRWKLLQFIIHFSSDNCTYHSLGIAFFSRLNSLKKIILFFNFSIK